nr:porin family protein [Legionella quateirensis]
MLSLFVVVSSPDAVSGTMGTPQTAPWNYIATLSAGPVWQNGGETQTFFLTPEIEKTYAANKSTGTLADGEFFLGIQKKIHHSFTGQLGIAFATTSKARLNGEIWDDADPEHNNFVYSYKIKHSHIALKGKLLSDLGFIVTPWISASAGAGFNRASDFSNVPVIFEALPNPDFVSHNKTTFTYTLGAGVQKALNQNWQIGVGYEFADWGKSQLGRAFGQTLGTGLSLNHYYTHGVMFNITVVAG